MKVLMLNTFDEAGGAARAAGRLRKGVRELGIDSRMLVQYKFGKAEDVLCNSRLLRKSVRRLKTFLGTLPVRIYPNRPENNFSPALLPDRVPAEVSKIDPDLIHLHWLGAGFLRVESVGRLKRPLVWTLHDSWVFTGGCHVPSGCERYRLCCGACPVLGSARERDLSRRTWRRKEKTWGALDLTLVAPSRWMAECARSSALFRDARVEVIPNGLDTGVFKPRDKEEARNLLSLPRDKKIILFGAVRAISDPNKGLHLLTRALQTLGKDASDHMALVFSSFDNAEIPELGMPSMSLGPICDDHRLAAIYSAADVFVVPSLQESFCLTAAEAMACGTPVAAFGATGLLDVVEDRACGYLANPYDIEDLARGIGWILEDGDRHADLSRRARMKAENEYSLPRVSRLYAELYQRILRKP